MCCQFEHKKKKINNNNNNDKNINVYNWNIEDCLFVFREKNYIFINMVFLYVELVFALLVTCR